MANAFEKLQIALRNVPIDPAIMADAQQEHAELTHRVNTLEELLIMIVRTGWPWDEEGGPNPIYHTSKGGFTAAMVEARDLLGLGRLSTITRTEPKT